MRRNLRYDHWDLHTSIVCPNCQCDVDNLSSLKCSTCEGKEILVECHNKKCKFRDWICYNCEVEAEAKQRRINSKSQLSKTNQEDSSYFKYIVVLMVVIALYLVYRTFYPSVTYNLSVMLKDLKQDFPSQRNETWYHLLSVLDKESPSVKSIIFLHGEDKKTPDCLTNKLVSLYSENKNIKKEEITFSASGYEAMDYGFALEHYRQIVKTFRVFVTDLSEVSGNIARIFHSLCDEVSSDIKPSLFIFTLKFDEKTKKLKPIPRANTILMKAWSDLPENEIHPLLSRIIKNVVDVVPEEQASC